MRIRLKAGLLSIPVLLMGGICLNNEASWGGWPAAWTAMALAVLTVLAWPKMSEAWRNPGTRRLRTRGTILGLWTLSALCLLWIATDLWTRRLLEQERIQALKLGELDLSPMLPHALAEDNGIWELERAVAMMRDRSQGPGAELWRNVLMSTWSSEVRSQAPEVIRETAQIGHLLRAATDRKAVRFNLEVPRESLFAIQVPHLGWLQQASNYLRACARVEASQGHPSEALDDLSRILHLARSLEEEPLLISGLVGIALRGIAHAEFQALFSEGCRVEPARMKALAEELRIDPNAMHRMLLGERCSQADLFDRLASGELRLLSCMDMMETLEDSFSSGFNPSWDAALTFASRPWIRWEETACLRYFGRVLPTADDSTRPLPESAGRGVVLTNFLVPALDKTRISLGRSRAQSGSARWGLAVLQCHARTGKLPASLDEIPADLIPDRPLDPFSGKPFVYHPSGDGRSFTIYSLGANAKDDGGCFDCPPGGGVCTLDVGISWKVAP